MRHRRRRRPCRVGRLRRRARRAARGGDDFGGQLSSEKLDLLDVGTLVWFANPGAARKVREMYEATSFISVLSVRLLVDDLVPQLAAAADRDPATATG